VLQVEKSRNLFTLKELHHSGSNNPLKYYRFHNVTFGTEIPSLVDDIYRQATRAKWYGGIILGVVMVLGGVLISLFLGRPIAFPFILGVSPLGDPNSVLGDVLPTIIGRVIERIGAVVVGIFIIQVMLGYVRYYFRIAEDLSMFANLLRLTEGKVENVAALGAVLLPSSIDFERIPRSPFEYAFRETVAKLPTR